MEQLSLPGKRKGLISIREGGFCMQLGSASRLTQYYFSESPQVSTTVQATRQVMHIRFEVCIATHTCRNRETWLVVCCANVVQGFLKSASDPEPSWDPETEVEHDIDQIMVVLSADMVCRRALEYALQYYSTACLMLLHD